MRIRSDFVAAFLAAGIPGSHVVSLQHVEPRVLLKLLALISQYEMKGAIFKHIPAAYNRWQYN